MGERHRQIVYVAGGGSSRCQLSATASVSTDPSHFWHRLRCQTVGAGEQNDRLRREVCGRRKQSSVFLWLNHTGKGGVIFHDYLIVYVARYVFS